MSGLMSLRELQLSDICPLWSSALRYHRTDEKLSIRHARYCIVGEAHGFSGKYNYTCRKCHDYSVTFAWCVNGSTIKDKYLTKQENKWMNQFGIEYLEEYKPIMREFLKHFNQAHKQEWLTRIS